MVDESSAQSSATSLAIRLSPSELDASLKSIWMEAMEADLTSKMAPACSGFRQSLRAMRIASASQVVLKAGSPSAAFHTSKSLLVGTSASHAKGVVPSFRMPPIPHGEASVATVSHRVLGATGAKER